MFSNVQLSVPDLGGRIRSSMARQSKQLGRAAGSSIHWKLAFAEEDSERLLDQEEEVDLENEEIITDEDEYCCHSGCSFVYNVKVCVKQCGSEKGGLFFFSGKT